MFIRLEEKESGRPVSVNSVHMVTLRMDKPSGCFIRLIDGGELSVVEDADDIMHRVGEPAFIKLVEANVNRYIYVNSDYIIMAHPMLSPDNTGLRILGGPTVAISCKLDDLIISAYDIPRAP